MQRTQIQLPDDLYQRAKRFAAQREMTLAEVVRRSLETYLGRYPQANEQRQSWKLPVVNCGGLNMPLEQLRDFLADEETVRSFPHPQAVEGS